MPPRYDINISQRASFTLSFDHRTEPGNAVIPFAAGTTAKADVRTKPGADLIVAFTTTTDNANGSVTLTLTAAQTALLEPTNRLAYDILINEGAGKQYVLCQGSVNVDGTITQ